jgi:hypothetical protein
LIVGLVRAKQKLLWLISQKLESSYARKINSARPLTEYIELSSRLITNLFGSKPDPTYIYRGLINFSLDDFRIQQRSLIICSVPSTPIFLTTMGKYYISALLLVVGCSAWSIGIIGSDQKSNQSQQLLQDNHCTLDKHCVDGYVCVKTGDNYIGVCGRVSNQEEKE